MQWLWSVLALFAANRYGQALSSEPMRVNFHPSSLLSIGDLLAFIRELSAASGSPAGQQSAPHTDLATVLSLDEQQSSLEALDAAGASGVALLAGAAPKRSGSPSVLVQEPQRQRHQLQPQQQLQPEQQPARHLGHNEAPPSIEQQMALGEGVTSRIPQRYLIQNLCGSHLWYWSYGDEPSTGTKLARRRVLLPAHSMQELKVGGRLASQAAAKLLSLRSVLICYALRW